MTHLRKKMLEELERRNYSASTTRCSLGVVQDLARYFQQAPDRLGPDQIRSYQAHLFRDCKLAGNTVSQRLAALRFFYLKTLRRSWNQSLTPYPKRARRLPSVLSPEEVARLIDCADSTFHRMLRMTLYATGVRRAHQAPSSGGASLILTGLSRTLPSRLVRIAGLPSHGCFILMPWYGQISVPLWVSLSANPAFGLSTCLGSSASCSPRMRLLSRSPRFFLSRHCRRPSRATRRSMRFRRSS